MIQRDKLLHFIAGAVLAAVGSLYSPVLGALLCLAGAVGKEAYDTWRPDGSGWDWLDLLATLLGGVVVLAAVPLFAVEAAAAASLGPLLFQDHEDDRERLSDKQLERLMTELLAEVKAHRAEALKAEHLQAVWTDERTWAAALGAMGRQLKSRTGNGLVDAIYGVFKKGVLFIMLGMLVYSFGGWNAVGAMLKSIFGGGGGGVH